MNIEELQKRILEEEKLLIEQGFHIVQKNLVPTYTDDNMTAGRKVPDPSKLDGMEVSFAIRKSIKN